MEIHPEVTSTILRYLPLDCQFFGQKFAKGATKRARHSGLKYPLIVHMWRNNWMVANNMNEGHIKAIYWL